MRRAPAPCALQPLLRCARLLCSTLLRFAAAQRCTALGCPVLCYARSPRSLSSFDVAWKARASRTVSPCSGRGATAPALGERPPAGAAGAATDEGKPRAHTRAAAPAAWTQCGRRDGTAAARPLTFSLLLMPAFGANSCSAAARKLARPPFCSSSSTAGGPGGRTRSGGRQRRVAAAGRLASEGWAAPKRCRWPAPPSTIPAGDQMPGDFAASVDLNGGRPPSPLHLCCAFFPPTHASGLLRG